MKTVHVDEEELSESRGTVPLKMVPVDCCSQIKCTHSHRARLKPWRAVSSDNSKALSYLFSRDSAPEPSELGSPSSVYLNCEDVCESQTLSDVPSCALWEQTDLHSLQSDYRHSLEKKCERVSEGDKSGGQNTTSLKSVYTELYITDGFSEEVCNQHEESHLEVLSKNTVHDVPIRCQDIFKQLPSNQRADHKPSQNPVRVAMTSGVAGVGKTFSVLKFCLDWAQGSENQDLDLVVPLTFRELNLAKGRHLSLLQIIHDIYPSLNGLSAHTLAFSKVLFIFDGLDESRIPLNFECEDISDVTQPAEVSVLLVNLLKGSLLPSALTWVTSRPAAASQIPAGVWTGSLKSEASWQIRRTSRSLNTMCQIPVFCWITASVLDLMLRQTDSGPLPQTLTDMYAHFLVAQIKKKKRKYGEESSHEELTEADQELFLKLGKLAFEQLLKEFLAAVYAHHCFSHKKDDLKQLLRDLDSCSSIDTFLKAALDKSLLSSSGHLDLFVRFLHGLIVESNRQLLKDLLGSTPINSETRQRIINNLKKMKTKTSPDRSIKSSTA
ncbi:hypothetical protein WMY93_030853 [Mugilogobius chulae]|uniref:NACHT domain-containing protein n=1 Tax=Mugilogobius chulae TaxID=88201 RepID=A0AAW0MQ49_9GOBI